jgi:DNA replication and repair protein RecF
MHLKNIRLQQFKNYRQATVQFSSQLNCFLGSNGSGKTNLLDAIHYLCLTKSAFNSLDSNNILHQEEFFTVFGEFEKDGKNLEIRCIVEGGKKKQLLQNGKSIDKMSEHVGLLPVVLIAPDDTQLIREGSEERRRFVDNMLSQLDKTYLDRLVRYQHFLKQRNALIKQFAEKGKWDHRLMEAYDREVIRLSGHIALARKLFIHSFKPYLQQFYGIISQHQEEVSVEYETHCLEQDFEAQFLANTQQDLILKRTNKGVHKDDFIFSISGYPIKKFGSQGQQKSFVIALKLAQFQLICSQKQVKAILLLDDIFDKLDDSRIARLMDLVADQQFGQIFITDARPERSRQILKGLVPEVYFYAIREGEILPEDQ